MILDLIKKNKNMRNIFITILLVLVTTFLFAQTKAVHIQKSGKGKPVLLLPGFTTPGTVWNETIQNIQGKYQFYAVSYAGFNGLQPIDTPWYATIKKELIQYIRVNKLSNIVIIGHSMGGNLAVDIAADLDDKVDKIILVESIPCMRELMMPGISAKDIQYNSPYNDQFLKMDEMTFRQTAQMMSGNMANNPAKVDTLISWAVKADRKTYVYGYTDLLKLDLREKLASLNAKTLILGASFPDKKVVMENYEKQYANLKAKQIAIASDSKHFIMFDQPEWFYTQVNAFLK